MILMNPRGIVIAALGLGTALALSWSNTLDPYPALMIMGLIFLVMDLGIRRPQEARDLVTLEEGGHFFFIPFWLVGIIVMIGYTFFW